MVYHWLLFLFEEKSSLSTSWAREEHFLFFSHFIYSPIFLQFSFIFLTFVLWVVAWPPGKALTTPLAVHRLIGMQTKLSGSTQKSCVDGLKSPKWTLISLDDTQLE